MMMPWSAAWSRAAVYTLMAASRSSAAASSPMISAQRSKLMFSSWSPISALVEGVKMGVSSLEEFTRPPGSSMPQTVPCAWYSLRPLPARYPRTMHSMGYMSAFLTSMNRPSSASA